MSRRLIASLGAAVALAAIVAAPVTVAGQAQTPAKKPAGAGAAGSAAAKKFIPPHLPWGDPDVSGNFNTKDEANTPIERPEEFAGKRIEDVTPEQMSNLNKKRQRDTLASAPYAGGGSRARGVALGVPIHWLDYLDSTNSRPWFVVDPPDGKVPPQVEAATQRAAAVANAREGRGTADSYTDRSYWDRCITRAIPAAEMQPKIYGNSFQILQAKDYVAIRYEMVHETRIIPIEGRTAPKPANNPKLSAYWGEATARFEGNTMIVSGGNYNGKLPYRGSSAALRTVERFTRTAPNKVEWTTTFEDAQTWTRPWTISLPLTEDDGQPIFEYGCHEGNYGLRNILSAGRSDDRKGIKSSNNADAQADLKGEGEE